MAKTKRMTKWQKNEVAMYQALTTQLPEFKDLKYANGEKDKKSSYDCFDDNCLVELKHRGEDEETNYGSQMLERRKGVALLQLAHPRKAYYVCYNCGVFYFYDLLRMFNEGYEFQWEDRTLPATSRFNNRTNITKRICMLPNEDADFTLNYSIK